MRAVVQRVTFSEVEVNNESLSKIKNGLTVLLGIEKGDNQEDIEYIVRKTSNLRVFEDGEGKMNLSVKDVGGSILLISQFTLCGDVRKGNRPSFDKAEEPTLAKEYYEKVVSTFSATDINIKSGKFQADMLVKIYNDGPVTILLDSKKRF